MVCIPTLSLRFHGERMQEMSTDERSGTDFRIEEKGRRTELASRHEAQRLLLRLIYRRRLQDKHSLDEGSERKRSHFRAAHFHLSPLIAPALPDSLEASDDRIGGRRAEAKTKKEERERREGEMRLFNLLFHFRTWKLLLNWPRLSSESRQHSRSERELSLLPFSFHQT